MINEAKFCALLHIAITEKNSRNVKKIKVKDKNVLKYIVRDYYDYILKEALQGEVVYEFRELGTLKVIEKASRRSYEWDKEYGSKDWEIIWDAMPKVKVTFDRKQEMRAAQNYKRLGTKYAGR